MLGEREPRTRKKLRIFVVFCVSERIRCVIVVPLNQTSFLFSSLYLWRNQRDWGILLSWWRWRRRRGGGESKSIKAKRKVSDDESFSRRYQKYDLRRLMSIFTTPWSHIQARIRLMFAYRSKILPSIRKISIFFVKTIQSMFFLKNVYCLWNPTMSCMMVIWLGSHWFSNDWHTHLNLFNWRTREVIRSGVFFFTLKRNVCTRVCVSFLSSLLLSCQIISLLFFFFSFVDVWVWNDYK